jgi:hypothetical protein
MIISVESQILMDTIQLRKKISLLPAIEGETFWNDRRREIRDYIQNGNPFQFMTWPVVQSTMFVGSEAPYLRWERQAIWDFGWGEFDNELEDGLDSNDKHQLYHLMQYLRAKGGLKGLVEAKTILEIGGGYGSMAKVWRRLGFKGKYYIFDLPEFAALQEFYLSNTVGTENTFWIDLNTTPPDLGPIDLMIACHSLSEMPIDKRGQIINLWPARDYLFAFNLIHFDMDNSEYFGMLPFQFGPNSRWLLQPANPVGAYYLIGLRG